MTTREKYYPGHPFIERIIQDALSFDHIVVDAFAGFGGVTQGFLRIMTGGGNLMKGGWRHEKFILV